MGCINFRFICAVVGRMCIAQIVTMLVCIGVSVAYGEEIRPFALGVLANIVVGLPLVRYGQYEPSARVGRREGMLTVTLTWLALSLLAVVPLMASRPITFWEALFEALSGFTTTGMTIYPDVEHLPHGVLFFRSIMQWQGGLGIVVFTVALIPIFGGGASQIFNAETTGINHDRFLPRISDVAKRLSLIYLGESLLLFTLLWIGPMNLFDAVCHTLSCISTGGYSTRNLGISHYDSAYVEYVLSIFMLLGSLNMTLVYFVVIGKSARLMEDEETRWFACLISGATLITTLWLLKLGLFSSVEETFRKALFHVASLGSSTGFSTENITLWLPFFWMLALLLMFVNGCAGSTSGGLKTSRFMVLVKNLNNEFKKQIHPHLLTPVVVNGKQIKISVVHQILAFCVLYILLLFLGAVVVMIDGNGFADSITLATSCISNTGLAIGEYASNLSSAGVLTKVTLSFLMLAGRLEVFTVVGIFAPHFWRR